MGIDAELTDKEVQEKLDFIKHLLIFAQLTARQKLAMIDQILNIKNTQENHPKPPPDLSGLCYALSYENGCPDCGAPIMSRLNGGAACTKCDWWFCY